MTVQTRSTNDILSEIGWVRRLATRLVSDRDVAEDLVQETLIAAVQNPPDADRPVRPWLKAILRNRWRMLARTDARRGERESTAEPARVPNAEELLEIAQTQTFLAVCIEELREPHRSLLMLRYYTGLKSVEIARHRGVPEGTVRRQIKEAIDELRARLDQRHGTRAAWRRLLMPLVLVPRSSAPLVPAGMGWGALLGVTAIVGGLLVFTAFMQRTSRDGGQARAPMAAPRTASLIPP
jgi:RNA polymerase sigma-70 factor (ECF subfamily)